MIETTTYDLQRVARYSGGALLGTIIVGIAASIWVNHGIDINMSGDVAAIAENMVEADIRLRAKAYIALLTLALEAVVGVGFYILLKQYGVLLAGWSLFVSLAASMLVLLGAVFAMNAAQIASHASYLTLASEQERLMLTGLQATSDYTSFHLGLILSSASNAGFFFLFLKSGLMPKFISAWGLFASILVVTAIVLRDFIPVLGHNAVTGVFMIANITALIATGFYLSVVGTRIPKEN